MNKTSSFLAVRDNRRDESRTARRHNEVELQITMLVCDVCERRDVPAKRYTLAVEDGEPIRKDLCLDDATPLIKLFYPGASVAAFTEAEAEAAPETPAEEEAQAEEEEPQAAPMKRAAPRTRPAAKKATAAKRTTAKKAAAKKTTAKKAAAKKTVAKKTVAKKTTGRGSLGARVTTLEEIEAEKAAKKAAQGS
ncbi:hypothetical protein [Streptomyces sp. NPDC053048]|uniref:hypothetical protein n=1 Tax=Streptomyces sp. NPDC053048 TaxID=3365694 RepID=UPI0037D70375